MILEGGVGGVGGAIKTHASILCLACCTATPTPLLLWHHSSFSGTAQRAGQRYEISHSLAVNMAATDEARHGMSSVSAQRAPCMQAREDPVSP